MPPPPPPRPGDLGVHWLPLSLSVWPAHLGFTHGGPGLSVAGREGLEKGKPKSVRVNCKNNIFHIYSNSVTLSFLPALSSRELFHAVGLELTHDLPHGPTPSWAETSTPLHKDRVLGKLVSLKVCGPHFSPGPRQPQIERIQLLHLPGQQSSNVLFGNLLKEFQKPMCFLAHF